MTTADPTDSQTACCGHPAAERAAARLTGNEARDFVYPWADPGLPSLALDALLAPHEALLRRIKVCYGATAQDFDRDIMSLVRRYAALVHLLPATPDNYFSVPGGLLQLGLETAFFALQGTDAHIFSGRATISTRRHLEPRWRLATFIAGLCSELQRTLSRAVVTDQEGNEWPWYLTDLHAWLEEQRATHYHVRWLPRETEVPGLSLFVLPHVVTDSTLQHLAADNHVVIPHLMACLCGMPVPREHNILDELVRRASTLVIDRFLNASADRQGMPVLGTHLARHLIDGFRRLTISSASWQPNTDRSRVWLGQDGVFLVWPGAANDLHKLIEAEQLPGIPRAAERILQILLAAGMAEPQAQEQPTWTIRPPGAKEDLEAVKLSSPTLLWLSSAARPSPLPLQLALSPAGSSPTPMQTALPAEPSASAPMGSQGTDSASGAELNAPSHPTSPCSTDPAPPTQLDLIPFPEASRLACNPSPDAAAPRVTMPAASAVVSSAGRAFALAAPLRLAPAVRQALEQVIELVRTEADVGARLSSLGLTVALSEFERRGVPPPVALRALSDCQMVPGGPAPEALSLLSLIRPGHEPQRAVAISSKFLVGLTDQPRD